MPSEFAVMRNVIAPHPPIGPIPGDPGWPGSEPLPGNPPAGDPIPGEPGWPMPGEPGPDTPVPGAPTPEMPVPEMAAAARPTDRRDRHTGPTAPPQPRNPAFPNGVWPDRPAEDGAPVPQHEPIGKSSDQQRPTPPQNH